MTLKAEQQQEIASLREQRAPTRRGGAGARIDCCRLRYRLSRRCAST
jgi:hypothetical protein